MSQCVPNWDLDDSTNSCRLPFHTDPNARPSAPDDSIFDYEIAELTWENGQLAMHGLGQPRPPVKPLSSSSSSKFPWEKPHENGTLESIVEQATCLPPPKGDELVPWFDNPAAAAGTSAGPVMDALVPCSKSTTSSSAADFSGPGRDDLSARVVGSSTRVGSCSGAAKQVAVRKRERVVVGEGSSQEQSLSGCGSRQVTMETYEMDLEVGLTSTSHEQTSVGRAPLSSRTRPTAVDDHDSVCHSRPQRETGRGVEKNGRSSISTKRSRAAAIHNQSERKRRDRINQRMKTLQKLVPNSSKTDKASMLDEVIEYLKQLQAQVQMMSKMSSIPHMMMPMAIQQLQMSMMAQMGMGMGMGMGVMNINSINRTGHAAPTLPPLLHPAAFLPLTGVAWDASTGDRSQPPAIVLPDPFSAAILACQTQQPMNLDAYNRMAAMYQQLQQSSGLSPPNSNT